MPVPWAEKSCLEKFAMILLVAVGTPIGKFETSLSRCRVQKFLTLTGGFYCDDRVFIFYTLTIF